MRIVIYNNHINRKWFVLEGEKGLLTLFGMKNLGSDFKNGVKLIKLVQVRLLSKKKRGENI